MAQKSVLKFLTNIKSQATAHGINTDNWASEQTSKHESRGSLKDLSEPLAGQHVKIRKSTVITTVYWNKSKSTKYYNYTST